MNFLISLMFILSLSAYASESSSSLDKMKNLRFDLTVYLQNYAEKSDSPDENLYKVKVYDVVTLKSLLVDQFNKIQKNLPTQSKVNYKLSSSTFNNLKNMFLNIASDENYVEGLQQFRIFEKNSLSLQKEINVFRRDFYRAVNKNQKSEFDQTEKWATTTKVLVDFYKPVIKFKSEFTPVIKIIKDGYGNPFITSELERVGMLEYLTFEPGFDSHYGGCFKAYFDHSYLVSHDEESKLFKDHNLNMKLAGKKNYYADGTCSLYRDVAFNSIAHAEKEKFRMFEVKKINLSIVK